MGDLPQSKGEQAAQEILAAAKYLFLTQGYNGTSMRAIAREAGDRSVAGLYNHFPTKRALFEALLQRDNPYDELFGTLESIRADTAQNYMDTALRMAMRILAKHYDFIQLIQIDLREFQGETMRQILAPVLPRGFAFIAHFQNLPGLKPEEGIMLARFIGSVLIGYVLTEQLAPSGLFDSWSVEEWTSKFAQFALYGIAGQDKHA